MLSCYVSLTLITRQIGEVTFKIETRLISIHLGLVTATLGDSWQSCWLRRCEQLALLCTCTLAIDHLKTCPSSSLKFERPAFNIQSFLQMAYPRAIVLQFYHEDCGKRFHHTFYFDRTPPGTWTLISQQVSSWTLIVWLTSSQPLSGSIRDVRDYTTTHVRTSESMPMRAMFWLSLSSRTGICITEQYVRGLYCHLLPCVVEGTYAETSSDADRPWFCWRLGNQHFEVTISLSHGWMFQSLPYGHMVRLTVSSFTCFTGWHHVIHY